MTVPEYSYNGNSVAYIDARVYTVDERNPWAEAFIVSAPGYFTAVGSNTEVLSLAQQHDVTVRNLHGVFIMPGIHDAHTHLLHASMQKLNEIDIGSNSTPDTIVENLKKGQNACACAYAHVRGDWLIANFYAGDNFPDGKIDHKYLDDSFPDQPVIIRDISCHNIVLNTAGLMRASYDIEAKENPSGGAYVRRPDGSWTGELVEYATARAWCNLPKPPIDYVKEALQYGIKMSHQHGITSAQEASANSIYLQALQELESEGHLNMNLFTHIVHAPETFAEESQESLHWLIDVAHTFHSEHVDTRFVRFWMDGAPTPPHFTHSGLDQDGCPDERHLLIDADILFTALSQHDSRGLTCKIHCAGEGNNPEGPRHELAHCNAIHEDDILRMARLRITAEMSPALFHETSLTQNFPHFKWPFKALQNAGVHVTVGSDWIMPPTPEVFPALAAIVETLGTDPGRTAKETGGEKVCRMITLFGAEAVGREKESGSIEVGKKANFIAVDRDLSRGEFAEARVLKTWVEGKLMYVTPSDQ
ncbi:amidohydrolase 3 [Aspergillus avenaceus]|uniref:Amidohydrolase 3 n=1 Tax=Aspergillus avenaceus TaxID=36643 RepID=A0A5N6TRE8_ASPAV|nr:amidohydrolase 3 [Aspergillus avenaceus]